VKHDLKTWPEPFEAVSSGEKTHEIRRNDREFNVGDTLCLNEWIPDRLGESEHIPGKYTGYYINVEVTHVTRGGDWSLPPWMCVMSIRKVTP
jgi:hypothetical protein